MKYRTIYILILVIIFHPFCAKSDARNPIGFIENVGQWEGDFLYRYDAGNSTFFINNNGHVVSTIEAKALEIFRHPYEIRDLSKIDNIKIKYHTLRRSFIDRNKKTTWINQESSNSFDSFSRNFIKNNKNNSINIYESVIQKDIYDGINIQYYFENDKVKYDIIVSPFINPKKIKFNYEGSEGIYINNETLIIKTSLGEFREEKPYAYQIINNKKIEVTCSYEINRNKIISFKLGDYNPQYELIIDPTLLFASYSGSRAENWGMCSTPGPDGSLFIAGINFGQNYPVSTGAYQSSFSGGDIDITISKFSSNGKQLIYSTYLGGQNTEVPVSIIADKNGDLLIMGRTNSGISFPHKNMFGSLGSYDIFITKLSSDGKSMIGGIIIGGTSNEGANIDYAITSMGSMNSLNYQYGDNNQGDIIIDKNENIVVVSQTNSSNFPTLNGFQSSLANGQDCVIIKLTTNLDQIIFSTYYGGNNSDAASSVAINTKNEIVIAGNTLSSNLPGVASNVINSNLIGNIDGFLTVLSERGDLMRASYLGTKGLDMLYGLYVDQNDFIYISCISLGQWPIVNAAFVDLNAKQGIAKIEPTLSNFIYSTTFGTANSLPNIIPNIIYVDKKENVYVAGWGGSLICSSSNSNEIKTSGTKGMRVTPNAIESTTDGNDFYFFGLEKDSKRQIFGSFWGQMGGAGDHVDGGKSRFDSIGNLYLVICSCDLNTCPTTKPLPISNGARFPNRLSNCNAYATKIKLTENDVVTNTLNIYNNNEISFFPNPVNSEISINGIPSLLKRFKLSVYDETGKLIIKEFVSFNKKINIEKLRRGLYLFRISDENGLVLKESKIIKQ